MYETHCHPWSLDVGLSDTKCIISWSMLSPSVSRWSYTLSNKQSLYNRRSDFAKQCTGGRTTVKTEIASVNVSTIAYTHNSGTDFEPELVLQYSTRLSWWWYHNTRNMRGAQEKGPIEFLISEPKYLSVYSWKGSRMVGFNYALQG